MLLSTVGIEYVRIDRSGGEPIREEEKNPHVSHLDAFLEVLSDNPSPKVRLVAIVGSGLQGEEVAKRASTAPAFADASQNSQSRLRAEEALTISRILARCVSLRGGETGKRCKETRESTARMLVSRLRSRRKTQSSGQKEKWKGCSAVLGGGGGRRLGSKEGCQQVQPG